MRKPKHNYNITEITKLQNETDSPRSLAEVGRLLNIPTRSLEKYVHHHYRRHITYIDRGHKSNKINAESSKKLAN